MSMPSFPNIDPPIQREDAVNQILSSIAMEELGLSHILNAEGEKLQYILGTIPGLSGPPPRSATCCLPTRASAACWRLPLRTSSSSNRRCRVR